MRRNKERAGEFMESSRKRKKKKKVENERARKRKRGKFWNQVESKDKKKERMESYEYVCGGQNAREKKRGGNVWMKETQRIRNHNLKIIPQYFHNKF